MRIAISMLFILLLNAKSFSQDERRNIILLIGDGMGLAHVNVAMLESKTKLNIERAHSVGLSKTNSGSDLITDSGAGATAIATGNKTYNGAIGLRVDGDTVTSILEFAGNAKMSTGLISTSSITHATPASFISHNIDRDNYEEIALDFLRYPIDIFIGGGKKHFEERADKQNLSEKLRDKGWQVVYSIEQFDSLNDFEESKVACLTADFHMPSILDGRSPDFLFQATSKSIEKLSANDKGFFLMVEGSQIDWGGHQNSSEYVLTEVLDFDKAVGVACNFADNNPGTLVIITADHETGGLTIHESEKMETSFEIKFSTTQHTAVMVPVYAYGSGADNFSGIYENTELFYKMMSFLRLNESLK